MKILNFIKEANALPYFDLGHAEVYHFTLNNIKLVVVTNGKTHVVTEESKFDAFLLPGRTYIQNIFPELTGMERQFIQSGMFFGKFDGQSFKNTVKTLTNDTRTSS